MPTQRKPAGRLRPNDKPLTPPASDPRRSSPRWDATPLNPLPPSAEAPAENAAAEFENLFAPPDADELRRRGPAQWSPGRWRKGTERRMADPEVEFTELDLGDGTETQRKPQVFGAFPRRVTVLPRTETNRADSAVVAVRLLALLTGVFAIALEPRQASPMVIGWLAAMVVLTLARLFYPVKSSSLPNPLTHVMAEMVLVTAATISTGSWSSPFVAMFLPPVAVAGLVCSTSVAVLLAGIPPITLLLAELGDGIAPGDVVRDSSTWLAVLTLVAAVSGILRRVSNESEGDDRNRVHRLLAVNDLLSSLYAAAQHMPSSLDLAEVLDSTMGRLRSMVNVDALAVLLDDGMPDHFTVAAATGLSPSDLVERTVLPVDVERRLILGLPIVDTGRSGGVSGRAASTMYIPLVARNRVLGVIVVEDRTEGAYGPGEVSLLKDLAPNLALEIDNARWFARLRTVGADEERNRIARDLHDRIGQALAYLGFELDRLNKRTVEPEVLRTGVARLRVDVRSVVQEVRDTLYDLRTEVTDAERLQVVLAKFCSRVAERSGLVISLDTDPDLSVPMRQERELWRIGQEALVNVERHARAEQVTVTWRQVGETAQLEIVDDGQGFRGGRGGRSDSYGLLGMRERAAAIGAVLTIEEGRAGGTRVCCSLAIENPRRVPDTSLSGGKGK